MLTSIFKAFITLIYLNTSFTGRIMPCLPKCLSMTKNPIGIVGIGNVTLIIVSTIINANHTEKILEET